MVGGPDQKQTKISQYMFPKPRTIQTGGKFNFKPTSMSLNTKATSREFISASDLTRPASPHKENIEQMDYDVSKTRLSIYLDILSCLDYKYDVL